MKLYGEYIIKYGEVDTWIVETGRKGPHLYFKYEDWMKPIGSPTSIKFGDTPATIDIRSNGSYIVSPGSIHPDTKETYRFINLPSRKPIIMPETFKDHFLRDILNEKIIKEKRIQKKQESYNPTNYKSSIEEYKQLLDIIDARYYEIYDDYLKLCFAIGSLSNKEDSENLYEYLKQVMLIKRNINTSKRLDKRFEDIISDDDDGITIGTFYYYAKESNKEAYNIIMNRFNYDYTKYTLPTALNGIDKAIAKNILRFLPRADKAIMKSITLRLFTIFEDDDEI